MMKNKGWEDRLRSGLEEYEKKAAEGRLQDMPAPDWQRMESMLGDREDDPAFDLRMKKVLSDARMHGSEAGWTSFRQKIALVRQRRNRILIARALELSLVMLILWTIYNAADQNVFSVPSAVSHGLRTVPGMTVVPEKKYFEHNVPEAVAPPEKSMQESFPSHSLSTNSSEKSFRETAEKKSVATGRKQAMLAVETASRKETAATGGLHLFSSSQRKDEEAADVEYGKEKTSVTESITQDAVIDHSKAASEVINAETAQEEFAPAVSTVAIRDADSGAVSTVTGDATVPCKAASAVTMNIKLQAGFGPMLHLVDASATRPAYMKDYRHRTTGTGWQGRLLLDYGNWMLESGVDYHEISYEPGDYYLACALNEGEIIDIVQKMHFRFFEIPLNLHRRILHTDRWKLTAFAGMSLAVCQAADYLVVSARKEPPKQALFNAPGAGLRFIEPVLNNGVGKDHSLGNNSIGDWNAGLLAEYRIDPWWSAFVRASYGAMMGTAGFGPLNERFSSMAATAGLSLRLK